MASGSCGTSLTDGTNDTTVTEKSRRGIVNMLKVKKAKTKGVVQKVDWNDFGKPIGKGSVTLSHYFGSFTRQNIPITCDNWRKKDWHNIKEALWDEIKETFHGFEEKHKKLIISRAGDLHRQWRTRFRNLAKDSNGKKVKKIKSEQKQWWRDTRSLIKIIKACEKNPVVTRLDAWEYARQNVNGVVDDPVTLEVLEDVVTISNQLSEHELTSIGMDDLLDRLIPLEYPGRVRGLGFGVTKTSLQAATSVSELSKLKNDIYFLKNEINELKCKAYNPGVQSGGSSHMDNFDMDDNVDDDHDDNHDDVLSEDLPEGGNAYYLYLEPGRRYVGRGILWNDISDRMIHGVPLEEGYTPQKTKNKEKGKNAKPQEEVKDKEKEKTVESMADVSSRKLGYPLSEDVSHDGVVEMIEMGPFWDGDPWTDHINKENVLEVYLSENPDLAVKFSFASPHIVSHLVDNFEASTNLAKFMLEYVDKVHLLMVLYNVSEHWVLLAINTKIEGLYFMDPAPRGTIVRHKNLKQLVETALVSFRTVCGKTYTKTVFNTFKWSNILCLSNLRIMAFFVVIMLAASLKIYCVPVKQVSA